MDSEYWTDIEGKTWKLEEMHPQHQINVLNFIRERALALYLAEQIRERHFDPFEPRDTSLSQQELLLYIQMEVSVLRFKEQLEQAIVEAQEWAEEQPIVKRLKELTDEEGRIAFVKRWKESRNGRGTR